MRSNEILKEVLKELRAVSAKFDELLEQPGDDVIIYMVGGDISKKLDKIIKLLSDDAD
jgi:hypothetical protein